MNPLLLLSHSPFTRRWPLLVAALLLAAGPVWAQKPPQRLRIATRIVPPFVQEQDGRLTGFSIELWHAIALQMGIDGDLNPYPSVGDLLAAVKSGKADLGIAAVSITAE